MIRSVNLFPGCLRSPTTRCRSGALPTSTPVSSASEEVISSTHRGRAQRNERKNDDFEPAPHLQR